MYYPVIGAGAIIMLIGAMGIVGVIPLSVLDTVDIRTPTVSCGSSGACSVSLSFTNNNATSNFNVYMKVVNSQFQTVWLNTINVQSSTSTVNTGPISIGTLRPGAYIFTTFAVSVNGAAISETASIAFNVQGNYKLTISPPTSTSGSVSPSCPYTSPCSYPVGQSATITYTPITGYKFVQWTILPILAGGSTGTPRDSVDNPLTLKMDNDYEVILTVQAPNVQYFIVTPIVSTTGGCPYGSTSCTRGAVTPAGETKIYQDGAFGPAEVQFTATPSANYTFANWQTNDKNLTANPLVLKYADLKPLQTSGQTQFYLYAYFKAKTFYPLGIGAYAGITTSPMFKNTNYVYAEGQQVTVSISSVDPKVCFTGWLVDGKDVGIQDSVTVTMTEYHHVFAQGVGKPSGGCDAAGGDGGDGEGASIVPVALLVGGAVVAGAGAVMGRRDDE